MGEYIGWERCRCRIPSKGDDQIGAGAGDPAEAGVEILSLEGPVLFRHVFHTSTNRPPSFVLVVATAFESIRESIGEQHSVVDVRRGEAARAINQRIFMRDPDSRTGRKQPRAGDLLRDCEARTRAAGIVCSAGFRAFEAEAAEINFAADQECLSSRRVHTELDAAGKPVKANILFSCCVDRRNAGRIEISGAIEDGARPGIRPAKSTSDIRARVEALPIVCLCLPKTRHRQAGDEYTNPEYESFHYRLR